MNIVTLAAPPCLHELHGELRLALFDILSPLGSGPASVTSSVAFHNSSEPGRLGLTMAMKSYNRAILAPQNVRQIQQQAILAGSMVDQPFILPVYGLWDEPASSRIILLTKLAERGNLYAEMSRSHGRLSEGKVSQITRAILIALQFIHSRGIVHGNVKPENVLFGKTLDEIYLSDLGLAMSIGLTHENSLTTRNSSISGASVSTTGSAPPGMGGRPGAYGLLPSPPGAGALSSGAGSLGSGGAHPRERRVSTVSTESNNDLTAVANLVYNMVRGFTSPAEFLHHLDAGAPPSSIIGIGSADVVDLLETMLAPGASAADVLRHPFITHTRRSSVAGDAQLFDTDGAQNRLSSGVGARPSAMRRASMDAPSMITRSPASRTGSRVRFVGEGEALELLDVDEVSKPVVAPSAASATESSRRRASIDTGVQAHASLKQRQGAGPGAGPGPGHLITAPSLKSGGGSRWGADGNIPALQRVQSTKLNAAQGQDWASEYEARIKELNAMAATRNNVGAFGLAEAAGPGQGPSDARPASRQVGGRPQSRGGALTYQPSAKVVDAPMTWTQNDPAPSGLSGSSAQGGRNSTVGQGRVSNVGQLRYSNVGQQPILEASRGAGNGPNKGRPISPTPSRLVGPASRTAVPTAVGPGARGQEGSAGAAKGNTVSNFINRILHPSKRASDAAGSEPQRAAPGEQGR